MDRDKFRVWCINKKEWEKDRVFISLDGTLLCMNCMGGFQELNTKTHIKQNCIGLKDKNKTLVYEGDIIKTESQIGVVEWSEIEQKYLLVIEDYVDDFRKCAYLGFYVESNQMSSDIDLSINGEVVGNIFENIELWKEVDNGTC